MGIVVEFNPDLALRNKSAIQKDHRQSEECIPSTLEEGKTYSFLKKGQRCYWLHDELPLVETQGEGKLSAPIASIIINEVTHYKDHGSVYSKGNYTVIKIIPSGEIYFNGINKIS